MRKIYFIIISIFTLLFVNSTIAQDTVRIMQYNLLYYGANYDNCNEITNNVADKEQYLRKIVAYYKPDILSCNELGNKETVVDRLLDSVFNYNGNNDYARAAISNVSNSSLITMLYYNKNKFGLLSQYGVKTKYRDFAFHKLYYKAPDLSTWGDTAFINCISTHLKAGNTPEDAIERKSMVDSLMKYLNKLNTPGNYLLLGDMNFYTAFEPGFQTLVNHPNLNIRFYDPIDKLGDWQNNQAFVLYHTQSTHTSGNGCPSTGGLNDRFDFILVSSYLLNAPYKYVKYIPNSYKTPGQDGQRLNASLINPQNYSAPPDIIDAMYNLSDHLPVMLDLQIGLNVDIKENFNVGNLEINFQNPIINDEIRLQLFSKINANINVKLYGIMGNQLFELNKAIDKGENFINISTKNLSKGIYLLNISGQNIYPDTFRVSIP